LKEPATITGDRTDRRRQRRAAAHRIVSSLTEIRDAEESYRAGIPENPSGGPMAEAADETVRCLDEAIGALEDAWQS
jgi:hypothetical protein